MIVAVITPWTIRNYRLFHRFMPLRSNFWMEVRVGNTGDISDIYPDWAHPSTSVAQWNELHRVGEVAFMAEMRGVAVRFGEVRSHERAFCYDDNLLPELKDRFVQLDVARSCWRPDGEANTMELGESMMPSVAPERSSTIRAWKVTNADAVRTSTDVVDSENDR